MKRTMQPIKVYAWTEEDGTIHPVKITTATRKEPLRVEQVIVQCLFCNVAP